MIDAIKRLFSDLAGEDEESGDLTEEDLHRVTAALLTEIMIIDGTTDTEEIDTLRGLLEEDFGLSPAESSELIDLAAREVNEATSLYQFTALVNEHFSTPRKQQLMEALWRVAYADGRVDKLEEATIRKIADLIHVGHADFILAKHRARDRA